MGGPMLFQHPGQPLVASSYPAIPGPIQPAPQTQQQHHDSEPLRVSSKTKLTGLAGAITKRLRSSKKVTVEAMGAESVATGVMSLALARMFLIQVSQYFIVRIESISTPSGVDKYGGALPDHPGLRFIAYHAPGSLKAVCKHITFTSTRKVQEGSQVAKVAGSLAKMLRTAGSDSVIGMLLPGTSSALLNTAIKSLALARAMLKPDSLDLYCIPFHEGGDQRSNKINIAIFHSDHPAIHSSLPDLRHSRGTNTITDVQQSNLRNSQQLHTGRALLHIDPPIADGHQQADSSQISQLLAALHSDGQRREETGKKAKK
eukprot:TRINITY_DN3488_c0_g2_i1.p1 TRINITY_DN3488_c0_g2~~TRINITY_DN3488_c0_g2_i1.p1  ORF type:complete len:358 (+),score=22.62 TRINITY_DN3488_c0_g2_i1:128-1075(+)